MRIAGVLACALGLALAANAATPRSICACTTKEGAYRAAMKADLRNLVTAQEAYFTDSARYATSIAELDSTWFRLSRGVEFEMLSATRDGFSARVRYPSGTTEACWINVGAMPDGSENVYDGEPRCDGPPSALYPIITGRIYLALFLIAFAIRFLRAGRSYPPMSVGTVARFVALAVIHPYWPHNRRDMSCYSNAEALETIWVVMMAGIAVWMAFRQDKSWEPPQAA